MAYRPQSVYPDPPEGWEDTDFVYYFDPVNTPALGGGLPAGETIQKIPLQLQPDADFYLRGIQISGNTGRLGLTFWTPAGDPISQVTVEADRAYSGTLNGNPPVGRLPVMVEPEIFCPAGSQILLDLTNIA